MIKPIETKTISEKGKSPQGISYRVKRPLNDFEIEIRDKVNELINKFNECFQYDKKEY